MALAFAATRPASGAGGESEALIREGIELRRAGRDTDALPKFERAYAVSKSARAAAQLGLCLQALSRWVDADRSLAEALSASNDVWVKKNRETIKDALEQVKAHVGRVEIIGKPDGASVSVNGRAVGTLPLPQPVPVNEGAVDIEVTAEGYQPAYKVVQVAGATLQSAVFRLEKTSVAGPVATVPEVPPPDDMAVGAQMDATPETSRPIMKSPWFWVGAAAVVGAVVLGAVLLSGSDPKDPKFDQEITF